MYSYDQEGANENRPQSSPANHDQSLAVNYDVIRHQHDRCYRSDMMVSDCGRLGGEKMGTRGGGSFPYSPLVEGLEP